MVMRNRLKKVTIRKGDYLSIEPIDTGVVEELWEQKIGRKKMIGAKVSPA